MRKRNNQITIRLHPKHYKKVKKKAEKANMNISEFIRKTIMELTDEYLKEAAGNFKDSGEFEKVKISDIKILKADNKKVKIRMIQVVHDDTADRFYIIEGKERALLVTVSLPTESLEGMGVRINKMLQTTSFTE